MPESRTEIHFSATWVSSHHFETCLKNHSEQLGRDSVSFVFPVGCKLMIDVSIKLLSLINQKANSSVDVILDFKEGMPGLMGYLKRMGFFENLDERISVLPSRPDTRRPWNYGWEDGFMEITTIKRGSRDSNLPEQMTQTLISSLSNKNDRERYEGPTWTIFAELIDNVYSHSRTPIDGFAAVQTYPASNIAKVAVSDSGLGILTTLRPSLSTDGSKLQYLSDIEIMKRVINEGISQYGGIRGNGLKGSAQKALKFNADLEFRLGNSLVCFKPQGKRYEVDKKKSFENLPLISGTHICYTYNLNK